MSEDRILQEAISAIENGQRARARDLLTRLLRQDQSRVDVWLYMSAVVDTPKERIFCLENVLKYDPDNQTAANGLVLLGVMQPDDQKTPVRPVSERKWKDGEIFEAQGDASGSGKKSYTKIPAAQMLSLIFTGVLAVALVLVGIFGNPFYKPSASAAGSGAPTSTPRPLGMLGPTSTTVPSQTPEGGVPTDNPSKPTALSFVLQETYTPTPLYVNTPHPNNEAYAAGIRSLNSGNYAQAIALFEQALEQLEETDDDLDIRYYIGLALLNSGELEDARRVFELILQEDSLFAPAYLGRARARMLMHSDINVAADIYKAIGIDSEYIEAYMMMAEYRIGRGEPESAMPFIEQWVKFAPDNAFGQHYLAEAYLALGEPEEALEPAQKAHELDVTLVQNYLTLGRALVENGRAREGYGYLDLYLRYDENKDNPMALYMFGRANQAYGNHAEAIADFEKAYSIQRTNYEMSHYWAVSLVAIGEYQRALERVTVPIERIGKWFEPYLVRAQAYYYLEEYGDAKEAVEEGAKFATSPQQLAELYYWRGLIYEDLGYPLIAKENWISLVEMDAEDVPPEYLLEAQTRVTPVAPTKTPFVPTSTYVPTKTPFAPTPTRTPTKTPTP
jgi:tetratricopeptide (TPR) repeat protein